MVTLTLTRVELPSRVGGMLFSSTTLHTRETAANLPLPAAPKEVDHVGAIRAHRAAFPGGGQILKQNAHHLQPHAALV